MDIQELRERENLGMWKDPGKYFFREDRTCSFKTNCSTTKTHIKLLSSDWQLSGSWLVCVYLILKFPLYQPLFFSLNVELEL